MRDGASTFVRDNMAAESVSTSGAWLGTRNWEEADEEESNRSPEMSTELEGLGYSKLPIFPVTDGDQCTINIER